MDRNRLLQPIILLLSAVASASAPEPKVGDCVSKPCGTINVTYPFWISQQQPSYCGFPQFELKCIDNIPVLGDSYHIKNISYLSQRLVVTDPQLTQSSCPPLPTYNITSYFPPFTVSATNMELVFFSNCAGPPLPAEDPYAPFCDQEGSFSYLVDSYGDLERLHPVIPCTSVAVPVLGFAGATASNYTELLSRGFLLNWTVADCSECKESGGECGYNIDANTFMCICSDRIHWKSCKKINHTWKAVVGGSVGGVGALILFVICFLWYKSNKRKQRSVSANLLIRSMSSELSSKMDPELGSVNYHTHIFSYEELHLATNGFDEELGDGGFGTVYKGQLRDGRIVAVKRLYENTCKRVEQFLNEVDILSRLRHKYLVTLYGCTTRHSRELLLVYEFISNGTVADHLHGPRASDGGLTWPVRLNIAIETADALAYLHAIEPQIIHRDVKTNNILLDNNFHVKVADFGLSRLFPMDASHVSTLPQGTPGYVDPEYHQCYQLTDKSDVYSFGVVLVELISSKPAVDITRHRHEINLASMAINKIQNRELEQLFDPHLGYQTEGGIEKMLTMVAELAFRCLQGESEMRPSIKEVLAELMAIQNVIAGAEKTVEANTQVKEESRLLKDGTPFSPDTVTARWNSSLSTPNASG